MASALIETVDRPEDIWEISDILGSPEAEYIPPIKIKAMADKIADRKIELYQRPSPMPGIAAEHGGMPGASPKQLAFWKMCQENVASDSPNRKRIMAILGANQASKTVTTGVSFYGHIRDRAINGDIYWIIAQSYKSLRAVPLRTMWEMLPKSMFGGRWTYQPNIDSVPILVLNLPGKRGKCEIHFKVEEMDIKELEAERVTAVLWTECRREDFLMALQPRLLKKGGWMVMDFLPISPWHTDFIENAQLPDSIAYVMNVGVVDNQHNLPPGAVMDMKPKSLGGRGIMSIEEWSLRGLGEPIAYHGIVYKQFTHEHVVKPFKIPKQWPLYIGADWGYRAPCAFAVSAVAPNESKYIISEEYSTENTVFEVCRKLWHIVTSFRPMSCGEWETTEKMFEALRREANVVNYDERGRRVNGKVSLVATHIRMEWNKTLAEPCIIDNQIFQRDQADGTALADEFERCGFPVQAAMKHNKDGSVELVRRHFEQMRLFFFDTCPYLIRDHRTWKYKEGRDGMPTPEDRYDKKNAHGCDGVMYLLRGNPCYHHGESGVESLDEE